MHLGICISSIDHMQNTRSEARQLILKLREQFDLTSVEIVLEGAGRRYAPYPWEWEEAELNELEEFLSHFQRRGAHLPFYYMNVIAVNVRVREEAMKQMRMAIEIAKRLKIDYAVAHATGSTEMLATDREPRRQSLALSRCADFCEGSDMTLSIENAHNLHDIESCAEMIRSLRREGLPVSMTFDTGHANIPRFAQHAPYKQYGTMADAIESCFDIIDNIHLHNNKGAIDQHMGIENGNIDLKSCVERLRDLNYKGSISLELWPGVKDIAREIAILKEWCEA